MTTSPASSAPEGRGSAAWRRCRDTAIAAAMLAKWEPSWREFEILVASWSKAEDLDLRLFDLLRSRVAPSRACADFGCMIACASPDSIAALVRERLDGFLPADVVDEIAEVAGHVAFGATVKVAPLKGASRAD
jgi:hypothetical protein